MADPLRLVPKKDRALADNQARMVRHLEHYLDLARRGELDQIGIVATFVDGGASTSSVEFVGKRLELIGAFTTWQHRIVAGYLSDDT